MDKNKAIDLDYLSVLEISGKGAFDLLQGQITCDVSKVSSTHSCLGALCNAKGRVISSFILSSLSVDTYSLIGLLGTLVRTEEELSKYSPFYEVSLKQNKSLSFYGIEKKVFEDTYDLKIGLEENTAQINSTKFVRYLDKKFLLVISDKKGNLVDKNLFEKDRNRSEWDLDEILSFNVEISEKDSEKYTPHELSYDTTKRIDFEKGCYTGQEIVARMHYRGKNLPRLNLAESPDLEIRENMTISNEENKKVGNIVKVVNLADKSLCLISTKEKNLLTPLKVTETNSALSLN
tara:strand:+ start:171 stop:1043 length:873 start_codon:yes stop_codon:yes gene_type:complete